MKLVEREKSELAVSRVLHSFVRNYDGSLNDAGLSFSNLFFLVQEKYSAGENTQGFAR